MLTGVYETLRSAGRPLVLELGEARRRSTERLAELREAARCLADDAGATERSARTPRRALAARSTSPPLPERLLDLARAAARAASAPRRYEEARKARRAGGARRARRRATASCCRSCSTRFADAYAAAKERESALDFEDLQLAARDLLRDDAERSASASSCASARSWSTSSRTRTALQCELIDLLAAGPGEREVFFVGDEFQSIYGFRHADVAGLPRAARRRRRAGSR